MIIKNYNKVFKIVISILLGLFVFCLVLNKFCKATGTICLIRGIIGIPCPSCGISRAIIAMLNGNIIEAFRYHPLFWLPIITILFLVINRKYFKQILIVAISIFIIMYIIRMMMFFPNIEPMKYNEKAIFNLLKD